VAVPDVSNGTVTASSATFESVAVTVMADPSSRTLEEEELRLTVGAASLSASVMLTEVPELANDADPPLTEPILTVAASEPS
jgi:hypothetical protein